MIGFGITFDIGDGDGLIHAAVDDIWGSHDLPDNVREIMVGSGSTSLEALYHAVAQAYRAQLEKQCIPETAPGMSLPELIALKADLYNMASTFHIHEKAKLVTSIYGMPYAVKKLNIYSSLGIRIDYNGKLVYSAHQSLFVPGAWVGILDVLYDRALVEQKRRTIVDTEKKRQQLLAELGML